MGKLIALITAGLSFAAVFFSPGTCLYEIDAADCGEKVGNKVSNVNIWEMGRSFYEPQNSEKNDIFDFVEYVQLMQCTGGNLERDLFRNPQDSSVTDDYDFERLVRNCRGIIASGAKPTLKLGNVPVKYSKNCKTGGFGVNILPPDDYDVYYDYIHALAETLVDEFGKEEVLSWHFCVFTEYENADWFMCENPDDSAEEFCKIYDYTAAALCDAIGDVYIGAHSMSVTEGLWDEGIFIKHCAVGRNFKTGETGSPLKFLSASYYEPCAGGRRSQKSLADTIGCLRSQAEKYGLELDYGVDEGRLLTGSAGSQSDELMSRTVGYTYQAAFDARIYGIMMDNDIDYFSMWSYKSDGLNRGNPTVSCHVARRVSEFADALRVKAKKIKGALRFGAEAKAFAAFDEAENTLHIMAYNYKNDIDYGGKVKFKFRINAPQFADGEVKITRYLIDDGCNYFDDWVKDREKYGITAQAFSWSPDCPNIGASLIDRDARELYYSSLEEKYAVCSELEPEVTAGVISGGELTVESELGGNSVVFYEISQ
ncbi:MAG: hypothetical protein K6F64_02855 [Clostridia bacterium]|nr:hypothetical protein [Clostridia bacterium]